MNLFLKQFIFLISFSFICLSSCTKKEIFPPKAESGALNALEFENIKRTFPFHFIPANLYSRAFNEMQHFTKSPINYRTENQWESLGPNKIAGRCLTIVVHPVDTNQVWVGTAGAGLWKSTTGGRGLNAWTSVQTGYPVLGVTSIAINPKNPQTMYIGTGEIYNYQGTDGGKYVRTLRGSWGIGILKSTDGGISWSKSLDWGMEEYQGVWRIIIDPKSPDIVYTATTKGILKSIDHGSHWNLILDKKMAVEMILNPLAPESITVGVGGIDSDEFGIFTSQDGGSQWSKMNLPQFDHLRGRIMLANYQKNPLRQYALISDQFETVQWLRSRDGFKNYFYSSVPDIGTYQSWYARGLKIKDNDSSKIIAGGVDLFIDSLGNGNQFNRYTLNKIKVHADFHDIVSNPLDPSKIYLATDGGVYRSDDFGISFYSCNDGLLTTQFYSGVVDQKTEKIILGGLQDNNCGLMDQNGVWKLVSVGDGAYCTINHSDPNNMNCLAQNLNLYKSSDFGKTWLEVLKPDPSSCFISPLKMSLTDENLIYGGSKQLIKSMDNGKTWITLSSNPSLAPINSIELSSRNKSILAFSTMPDLNQRVRLYLSVDGGTTSKEISNFLPNRIITDISFHPQSDSIMLVSMGGFENEHLFVSQDFGENWVGISNGLPDVPFHTIVYNKQNPDFIFAGCDLGLFASGDGGKSWINFTDSDVDVVPVYDLIYLSTENKILVFTHGRGVFKINAEFQIPTGFKSTSSDHNKNIFISTKTELQKHFSDNDNVKLYSIDGQLIFSSINRIYNEWERIRNGVYYLVVPGRNFKVIIANH
ncbi:MAG: hypothetical protein IPI90_18955 [Saprospiraceae bacterium]|nr:hypothetical protein [Candidatus Vicinibacter affinis]MBK7799333.1 hypothetical protein [Candidatus Vicinibacter affinis]